MAAWQLDEACLSVGRRVENNINNGKEMWDGFGSSTSQVPGSKVKGLFRSAKQYVKKKMWIPESGVW